MLRCIRDMLIVSVMLGLPYVLLINAVEPSVTVVRISYFAFIAIALVPVLMLDDRRRGRVRKPLIRR